MRAPNSLRGPIAFPWLGRVPDLDGFPQLATLAALHSSATAAVFAILAAHPNLGIPPDPIKPDRLLLAANSLVGLIEALLLGLERYHAELDGQPVPCEPPASLRFQDLPEVRIPSGWSSVTAAAVYGFLEAVTHAVWDAHEPVLIEAMLRDEVMEEWERYFEEQERQYREQAAAVNDEMPF
jgi:hypothetical protein